MARTRSDYARQVRELTAFLGLSPDRIESEDLRRYQLRLASLGASYARINLACTALRFVFHVTLGRTGFGDRMARIPTPERLPVVLRTEEVALLLAYAPNLTYRAALSIAYGCGLRVSKIANLKVTDKSLAVGAGHSALHCSRRLGIPRESENDESALAVGGIGRLDEVRLRVRDIYQMQMGSDTLAERRGHMDN